MSDLIKREDAIKAIHNYWKKRLDTLPTEEKGITYEELERIIHDAEEEAKKEIARMKGAANEEVNGNTVYHADDAIYNSLRHKEDERSGQGRNITND